MQDEVRQRERLASEPAMAFWTCRLWDLGGSILRPAAAFSELSVRPRVCNREVPGAQSLQEIHKKATSSRAVGSKLWMIQLPFLFLSFRKEFTRRTPGGPPPSGQVDGFSGRGFGGRGDWLFFTRGGFPPPQEGAGTWQLPPACAVLASNHDWEIRRQGSAWFGWRCKAHG